MNGSNQILDPSAILEIDNIYKLFSDYFNNPLMKKLKNVNGYSMYITKINAMLGIIYRYLIVFVRDDGYPIGSTENLINLPWLSLQTRMLEEDYPLQLHTYYPQRIPELNKTIHLINKDSRQYVYRVDNLPITITLLPKRGFENEYNTTGNVISALETYYTIVSLNN